MPSPVPRATLRDWFLRPRQGRPDRVGAEFEMLTVDLRTKREAPFDGERGVEAALTRLLENGRGWSGRKEGTRLIALDRPDGATVTLEPGSQLEFATEPRATALEVEREIRAFVREFESSTPGMDLALIATGLNPFSSTSEVALGPKARYRIMTDYLSKKGDLALDMMRRTCSVHCSFDFEGEADAMEKTRVAFAVAPIVTALFASSPFEKLAPNGFKSFRGEVWRRTDPDRCGLIPEVFDPGFSFEKYLEVVLRLPLIFTYRDEYRPALGINAESWFSGKWPPDLAATHPGIDPKPDDLEWVINQSYRDARLRRYLECRAADFPPPEMATAPVALWTGILYCGKARAGVWEMLQGLSVDARRQLPADVARLGLQAKAGGREVLAIARDVVALAKAGLVSRGAGEEGLLAPVEALLAKGQCPADELLAKFGPKADAAALIERLRL